MQSANGPVRTWFCFAYTPTGQFPYRRFLTKDYRTLVLASKAKGMKRFKEERAAAASALPSDVDDTDIPKQPPKKLKTSKASTKRKTEETAQSSTPGMFQSYDLRKLGIPEVAWPQASRVNLGKHGYTVVAFNSAAICQ